MTADVSSAADAQRINSHLLTDMHHPASYLARQQFINIPQTSIIQWIDFYCPLLLFH